MELDRLLPAYELHSRFARHVAADPATVWRALTEVTAGELPFYRLLMRLRLGGRGRVEGPFIDGFPTPTLITVAGEELVKGMVARFWRVRPQPAPVTPGDASAFVAFDEPGWAKAALSLSVVPDAGGTLLTFETRVHCTDSHARRAFRAYWLLIQLGGAAYIRVEVLRAVARRAERATASRRP
ncbi:hypothetical protein AF335_11640 [Streptomyces eurocidicus]|uniref:Uncharacterized protein YndB with AHSA1/START domain n=1 Tax=Streptomyces eurocidicus TaxID=66423 RepID=A0A2N8NXM6_STREU|nr:hypothetical protein [Streptomyces eurocidicus]MBB5120574.1 uncharacterized protein YndB with AHSA1/START domain [Streptomyces eurocidicus]MBF6053784.1 hypothetical protein [Streptomyces eurocidicus]PNE33512.1 hypothetical protein AF335_11640 [Streptomyces eurocidicus]